MMPRSLPPFRAELARMIETGDRRPLHRPEPNHALREAMLAAIRCADPEPTDADAARHSMTGE